MHPRQQIRDAIVTAVTGLTTTGSNVFNSRIYRLSEDQLPAILVWTLNEDSDRETNGDDGFLMRSLNVMVEIMAHPSDTQTAQDELDDIALEIETALGADRDLGGLTTDLFLSETRSNYTDEGEVLLGGMSMTWTAEYLTEFNNPGGTP